jgi:peptidoglycan/xylan/chitin deacetylase (PgdA/CDA1 family)
VPWDPIGSLFAPLGLLALFFRRKKRKGSKWSALLVALLVLGVVGMSLAGCEFIPPDNTPIPEPPSQPPPSSDSSPDSNTVSTPDPTPIPSSTPVRKTAYLTFDDGPNPTYTSEIALYLESQGASATFFVNGTDDPNNWDRSQWKINYPCDPSVVPDEFLNSSVVRLLNATGHAIGIHGWYHYNPWDSDAVDPTREISWVEEEIIKSLGLSEMPNNLLRAPGGGFGISKIPYNGYENWYYYGWTINPEDYNLSNGDEVIDALYTELESKGFPDNPIILLHDIHNQTRDALLYGNLLGKMKSWGYTDFKALPRPGDFPGQKIGIGY